MDAKTTRRRVLKQGTVESAKGNKTLTVRVDRMVRHPKYGKFVRRKTKIYAHDENNTARAGDFVEVEFTRPLSKMKRWRLVRVMKAAPMPLITGAEAADAARGAP